MAASYNKFRSFVEAMAEKSHNLGSDVLKLMATATANAPVNTNTVKANLTEIAAGNGYSAGGTALTVTTSAQAAGTYTLAANKVVYTASGGPIAALQYLVLYNDTATSDELIAWWDYGASLTLNDGETLTTSFNSADPGTIFTLT